MKLNRVLLASGVCSVGSGGEQRTHALRSALSYLAPVDCVFDYDEPFPELFRRYNPIATFRYSRNDEGPFSTLHRKSPRIARWLALAAGAARCDYRPMRSVEEWHRHETPLERYDLIVSRNIGPAARLGLLNRGVPILVDVDEHPPDLLDSYRQNTARNWRDRLVLRIQQKQTTGLVEECLSQCSGLWVCKPSDLHRFQSPHLRWLPNVAFNVPESYVPPPAEHSKLALFVGNLAYPANLLGLRWFLKDVWPQVVARVEEARFRIVGMGLTTELREEWSRMPGVEPAGRVDDLMAEYRHCAFTVVPQLEGAGTSVKLIESMTCRRTAVVTMQGWRGFQESFKNGESVLVVQEAEVAVQACVKLMSSVSLCRLMGQKAYDVARRDYSHARFRNEVSALVSAVLGESHAMAA